MNSRPKIRKQRLIELQKSSKWTKKKLTSSSKQLRINSKKSGRQLKHPFKKWKISNSSTSTNRSKSTEKKTEEPSSMLTTRNNSGGWDSLELVKFIGSLSNPEKMTTMIRETNTPGSFTTTWWFCSLKTMKKQIWKKKLGTDNSKFMITLPSNSTSLLIQSEKLRTHQKNSGNCSQSQNQRVKTPKSSMNSTKCTKLGSRRSLMVTILKKTKTFSSLLLVILNLQLVHQ